MLTIRQANPADFDALVEIWEASVRATHDFLPEENIRALKPQVRELYMPQIPMLLAAGKTGEPLGFIGCHENRIEMLFVSPESRGMGVGKQLLQYAIEHLQVDEVDVNEQNPQGVGFYLHMGFARTGRSELDGEGNPFPLLHLKLKR
ncbi:acetyltransferase [Enterobacter sp. Ap-1006]|uniref:acetyltransferase n=1 Tax=Enterobacter sp. Ap-1006 TaxID=2608345 RepID=UPI00141F8CF8|nr:acetyltransferase [Enterobacter sp. Ap-1006]NIF48164.1 acetyltransferase [Enterobacter sp. Ap-1006]